MQLLTQISVSQYRAPKLEQATVILADGGSLVPRLRDSRLLAPSGRGGASSRNLGTTF